MTKQSHSIQTKLVHAGENPDRHLGSVATPIYQSSTYVFAGEQGYGNIRYARLSNSPTHIALHEKLAAVENAEDALATSSGMSAISTALLTFLKNGDHVLSQSSLYGGSHTLMSHDFPEWGIAHSFFDPQKPEQWKSLLKPNTKAIYVETITNPTVEVSDLEAAVKFAKDHDLISFIDNTFASPVNFNPIELGFDIVLHSCTKYLNGHTDLIAGAVIGSKSKIAKVKNKLDHLGGSLDPYGCFLLQRGMKTLGLRIERQNESALALAQFLVEHSAVQKVNYPGLSTHPQHARARKLFRGFGGMLSFELKGSVAETDRFISKLTIPIVAPSLGGLETLITRPATTSHTGLTLAERERAGVSDKLVRLSVGIESATDLIEDFGAALNRVA